MPRKSLLPLFPLPVVLFPSSSLPLHIFEERYKLLIAQCLKDDDEFGIILVRDGKLADVGCTARVTSVLQRYEDGRADIVVEGERRFRLFTVDSSTQPYLLGQIEYLDPGTRSVDGTLVQETVDLYNLLVTIVYKSRAYAVAFVESEKITAFLLAQKAGMPLATYNVQLEWT